MLHVIEGEKMIYDSLGHTFIQIIQNSTAEAINDALVTTSLSKKVKYPVRKSVLPTFIIIFLCRSRFLFDI